MDDEVMRNTGREYQSSSNASYQNYNILKLRLDTEQMLKNIELYLKGERELFGTDDHGNMVVNIIQETYPKANTLGINSIMSWLRGILSTQIVQGNVKDFEALNEFLAALREDMLQDFLINIYDWEIKEEHFEGIIDLIVTSLSLFLSRLVGNKERESYAQTLQHVERSDYVKDGKKKMPFF
jgi:hypothetical protein